MAYTPTDWVDNATPVNAANMDKLEQGVVDAHAGLPPSPTGQNGKWLTVSGGAMVWQSLPAETLPVTTFDAKGDILAASAADTVGRLAVGSNGQVLTADSPSALGVKWAAAAAAETLPVSIMDAKGDLIAATAADAAARLAVGANDQVLTADSAQATGLRWATPAGGGGTFAYDSHYDNGPWQTSTNLSASAIGTTIISPVLGLVGLAGSLVVTKIRVYPAASGGTHDIGLYYSDDGGVTFTRIASSGNIATVAGTYTLTISATLTLGTARRYYFGFVEGTVGNVNFACTTAFPDLCFMKTSTIPLPATLSGMSALGLALPLMSLVV